MMNMETAVNAESIPQILSEYHNYSQVHQFLNKSSPQHFPRNYSNQLF